MNRTIDDARADLVTLKSETDVAMAEANLDAARASWR